MPSSGRRWVARRVFAAHSGQACVAPTRMLVPEDRKAEVLEKAAGVAAMLKVGDPSDPSTVVGPLISAAQRERCERYVAAAESRPAPPWWPVAGHPPTSPRVLLRADGARRSRQLEPGGAGRDLRAGDLRARLPRRRPCGRDRQRLVFGLSGQVFGGDLALATNVAERIRAGAVQVNGGYSGAYASSGGYKQSGIGRERGVDGIRAFQQVKHLAVGARDRSRTSSCCWSSGSTGTTSRR